MDKADKLDLLQSTRRPFKSRDLAFSREVNRQGQRNRAISCNSSNLLYSFSFSEIQRTSTVLICDKPLSFVLALALRELCLLLWDT